MDLETKFLTVLMPVRVPAGIHCYPAEPPCRFYHHDSSQGPPLCLAGFMPYRHSNRGKAMRPDDCLKLVTLTADTGKE